MQRMSFLTLDHYPPPAARRIGPDELCPRVPQQAVTSPVSTGVPILEIELHSDLHSSSRNHFDNWLFAL